MVIVIWTGILGGIAVAVTFLCYCFRCVSEELHRKNEGCSSLICVAGPTQQGKVIEITKPQLRARRRQAR